MIISPEINAKQEMKNKVLFLVLILFLLLFGSQGFTQEFPEFIISGNKYIKLDDFIKHSEIEKYRFDYIRQKIYIKTDEKLIRFILGTNYVLVNDKFYRLSAPVMFYDSKVYIPHDFLEVMKGEGYVFIKKSTIDKPTFSKQKINKIRYFTHPTHTRIVFDTNVYIPYRESESDTHKLVKLYFANTEIASTKSIKIGDGVVKDIQIRKTGSGVSILINTDSKYKAKKVMGLKHKPYRVILDLYKSDKYVKKSDSYVEDMKIRTIVIDAGHGGKDPGGIGSGGLQEKGVVLSISKELANLLRKELKVKVIMTRTTDKFITLRRRTEIANENKADLFISVHANINYSKKVRGFEVYYLSRYASDDEARSVAAFENGVIRLEDKRTQENVKNILWDLISNQFENESVELAGFIIKNMKSKTSFPSKGIKHAKFYVLYGATMPAVLVEVGYLSNPIEAKFLKSPYTQKKIARAIFEGIKEYKIRYEKKINTVN